VSGIVIGILALTTMGAMANQFSALLDGGARYYADHVVVDDDSGGAVPGGNGLGSLVAASKVEQVRRVDGVVAAFPSVMVLAKPGQGGVVNLSFPDYVASSVPEEAAYTRNRTVLAAGRRLTDGSRGEVVLGSSFAAELGRRVGDRVDLPVRPPDARPDFVSHPFRVVGILARTLTAPDTGAFVSLPDAQTLMHDSLPAQLRALLPADQVVASVNAYGRPGASLDELADRITAEVPGARAARPSETVRSFRSGSAIFTAITTGAALLALVIGGLSVLNTMIMAVSERQREIGLKKALGAPTLTILREVVGEATLIGLLGGAVGFGLGAGLALLLDASLPASQPPLFLVDAGLAATALVFATALGAVAGLVPAVRAARLDPVLALRAQ
jgi:putative ABC transport system permease protein